MDDRQQRFRLIYDQTYDDLWRYCLRRCASREHAEDVLGETYAVAWRRFDDVPEPPASRLYLFGVARNLVRNQHRRIASQGQLTERLKTAVIRRPAASAEPMIEEDLEAVLASLHELSEPDQEVLRLAAWEQLPHAEIAEILDCSVNAVGIRLHRARDRLAKRTELRTVQQPAASTSEPTEKSERNAQ